MNAKNPRQIALSVLQSRRQTGEFTEILLDRALVPGPSPAPGTSQGRAISPADRALCHELVYGVVRAQSALDWLIARKTGGRQQNAGIQNVLRLGLYQVFWLDRIPAHAAVHETVELAKRQGFGPKAGFVNAVLRGFLREFDATKSLLAGLRVSNPAVAFSHPQWLVEKWEKRFGTERMRQFLEWNNTPPKNFARVNTLKTDAGKLLERWRNENVEYDFVRRDFLQNRASEQAVPARGISNSESRSLTVGAQLPLDLETAIFELKSHPPLASLESFREGWFYVQDPSTLLAPLELEPRPGEMVLDLCAAPGGKTTVIAQLMGNTGKIIASDVSKERLKLVEENCLRLGVTSVHPILKSRLAVDHSAGPIIRRSKQSADNSPSPGGEGGRLTDFLPDQNSQFDRILIDAPCSNTGVMRRRIDLRWRISPDEIARLHQTQLDLLNLAAPNVKPGGILVYSTCSLEPEENSSVIQEFLKENDQFSLDHERELFPFQDNVDGAYVAKLLKS
ncbi:MAG TPA: 16S rRNA (cytosine(967)-C(5))-methyltransferase RsmB [Verrucomicrobiae bacterium]|nr:16S rRNA (cytosine(967)-C(5))-methyltransferase RsmB [Verrucomicrobiae bacterium]